MAIPDQTPFNIYNANGISTVFPYEFYLLNVFDLTVSINGVEQSSGFTISGMGNVDGGEVTFLTPPSNGSVILLERAIPTYRLTEYQDNGDLLAETVNKDFDRLWMAIQQAFIYLGLALTRPLLGGPFNAKSYRIENLADPVNGQDAVTKNYAINLGNYNLARTLRVPLNEVLNVLPSAAQRKGKFQAYSTDSGQPILVDFSSGSAADLAARLASEHGASLIGSDQTNLEDAIAALPKFNNKFIIVFVFGQSNAVGEPDKDGAGYDPSQLTTIPEHCYYWHYDRETHTGQLKKQENFMLHCTGQTSTGSAWNEFSQTMLTETGYGLIYIPCAKGGTSLSELSKGSAVGYYQDALDSYTKLQESGVLNDLDIEYAISVFHQGETDMTLGTSRGDYQTLLRQFALDVRTDFGISNFYVYLVGNPFTRTEKSWNGGVQAAQYFLGSNRPTGDRIVDAAYPYIKLIDTGCTSYTVRNGNLAVDNTHYTIKGYNAMGRRGAIEVAKDLLNASTVSPFSTKLNDALRLPGFAQWIYTSAFINYSAANGWQLLTRDEPVRHGRARLSNVYSLTVHDDRLTINTGADNTYLLSTDANTGLQGGIRGLKAASSVSDKFIDVYMFARLQFRLDLTSPSTSIPVKFLTSSSVDALISNIISCSYDSATDTVTVNHPVTRYLPSVRFYSNSLSSVTNTEAVINILKVSDTQFKFRRSAATTAESQVVIDIEDTLVNPNLYYFDGLTLSVTAMTAEKTS